MNNKLSTKPEDWLNLIPCKLYNKKENESYLIVAVSNEGLYYTKDIQVENDDDFGWDPYYTINVQKLISFKELNKNFIIGDEPTKKQIDWLENHKLMHNNMTKQEAWVITNTYIKKNKNKTNSKYISRVLNNMLDAEDIIEQCGGVLDDY